MCLLSPAWITATSSATRPLQLVQNAAHVQLKPLLVQENFCPQATVNYGEHCASLPPHHSMDPAVAHLVNALFCFGPAVEKKTPHFSKDCRITEHLSLQDETFLFRPRRITQCWLLPTKKQLSEHALSCSFKRDALNALHCNVILKKQKLEKHFVSPAAIKIQTNVLEDAHKISN